MQDIILVYGFFPAIDEFKNVFSKQIDKFVDQLENVEPIEHNDVTSLFQRIFGVKCKSTADEKSNFYEFAEYVYENSTDKEPLQMDIFKVDYIKEGLIEKVFVGWAIIDLKESHRICFEPIKFSKEEKQDTIDFINSYGFKVSKKDMAVYCNN